jgi:hypothetical protein
MDVNELALVILHPNNSTFQVLKVNIMEDEIREMFESRSRALNKPGNDGTNPIVIFEGEDELDNEEMNNSKSWMGSD